MFGVPEVKVTRTGRRTVMAPGDVSRQGMQRKIRQVLDSLNALLLEVSASWADATAVSVCTVHDIHPSCGISFFTRFKARTCTASAGSMLVLRWRYGAFKWMSAASFRR